MEGTKTFSIVDKIIVSKFKLLNAISNYLNGLLNGTYKMAFMTAFPMARFEGMQRKLVKNFKDYEKELNSFSIESIHCVYYDGKEYSRTESVRRLTEIHLAVIREMRRFNEVDIGPVQDEYEKRLSDFIEMVRYG